jgi:cytochrome c biogenesis protein CcmG/thiol:disulfide interchange protein DsbE
LVRFSYMTTLRRYAKTLLFMGIAVAFLYVLRLGDSVGPGDLAPPLTRSAVPDIAVTDLHGKSWKLADHRGQVVLLNFWATWCPPCREETPGLVRLGNAYAQNGLAILGVSLDEDGAPDVVREFVTRFRIPYPVALPGEHFALANAVQSLPTTLLIDKRGRLAKVYRGAASESTFRTDVDSLLRESEE